MDSQLPAPDVYGIEVTLEHLSGTAASIHRAATRAGYTVRATQAIGPRPPKVTGQPIVRTHNLTLTGVRGSWRFTASHTIDGWDVTLHRPGWHTTPSNITDLRRVLTAQAQQQTALVDA